MDATSHVSAALSTPELALPAGPASVPARRRVLRLPVALPGGLARLLVVFVFVLAVVLLIDLPWSYDIDSWLALVTGREIWTSGLPHVETLTVLSHGVRWVDQQWLSQLASYAVYLVGGLGLLGVFNVAFTVSGVAMVLVEGWRRGVRLSVMLLTLVLCVFQVMPFREVRTQAFAFPLIAATLILLSRDSRNPSRRVYWSLPLLVVWANVHGTASLGVALVALRGVLLAWDRRGELRGARDWRVWMRQMRRPIILLVGAPLSLLATPYGLANVAYYRHTLFNSDLQHSVTEWQPITSHWGMAFAFFILVAIMIWSFGRCPTKTTLWDRAALLVLALLSIDVLRNDLLFGMAAIMIVPASLDGAVAGRRRGEVQVRDRLNGLLAWGTIALTVLVALATLTRPASVFEQKTQPTGMLQAVRATASLDPLINVMADVRYADWLLWREPALSGRVSSDARFELLSGAQMTQIQDTYSAIGLGWKQGARGFRLLVLNRAASSQAVKGFLEEPGRRILYEDKERIVILRTARAAG